MAAEDPSSEGTTQQPGDLSTSIGLLFALFFISAVFSLVPVVGAWCGSRRKGSAAKEETKEKAWKQILLGVLNCFSGGVFLGVTFLHLLPDITEDWEKIFSNVLKTSYPFDRFLVVIGFFIVLVIEQMAYGCQSSKPKKKKEKRVVPAPLTRTNSIQPNIVASLIITDGAPLSDEEGNSVDCEQCREEHARHTQQEMTSNNESEPARRSLLHDSARYSPPDTVKIGGYQAIDGTGDEEIGEGAEKKNEATTPGGLRAIFLGMALSVHSVFEGLAFGLIQSPSEAIQVFLGIAIHKAVIGLTLGIALVSTKTRFLLAFALIFIFVISSPIGIAIALSLSHLAADGTEMLIVRAVLQALASGTFIYITFLELIGHEFANIHASTQKHRLMLVLACLLGFSLFAGLSFIES